MTTSSKPRLFLAAQAEPSADDDTLMERAREGDRSAFDTLVVRHQPRLIRVAFRYLADSAAAADAVQNAFIELLDSVPRYHPCGKFKAFLYRLLLNQCRRTWRTRRTESRVLGVVLSLTTDSAHDMAGARSFELDLELGLSRLRPPERSIVLLHYAGGLTYQEIADTLDAPIGTVKRRVSEAVAKLRDTLEAS